MKKAMFGFEKKKATEVTGATMAANHTESASAWMDGKDGNINLTKAQKK